MERSHAMFLISGIVSFALEFKVRVFEVAA